MKHWCTFFLALLIMMSFSLYSFDNSHFYRATNVLLEPRLEHDFLSTFDVTFAGGSTHKSRSSRNKIVPLFDLFGTHSFQNLVNTDQLTEPEDNVGALLKQLNSLPYRTHFAAFSIDASFHIVESNLSFIQNFSRGFFLFFHIPVRQLIIKDIVFNDLSPEDGVFPNKNTQVWQQVLDNFNPIISYYGFDAFTTISKGVGDLTTALGWTHNYQETRTLDFIDFSFLAGFLAPTGKVKNERKLFSLPTGYNGHWGISLSNALSFGFYEWVTIGGYLNALFFFDKEKEMRVKTHYNQSSILKGGFLNVEEHRGPLITTGLYCKADHVGHGVSVTSAYSYATQQKSHLKPKDLCTTSCGIINSDEMLKGWNMHTLNFLIDYDSAREDCKIGNRIGIFYNLQIAGSRVFATNMIGGNYGIDISLSF